VGIIRNANAARLRNGLEACGYVNPFAEYVSTIFDYITNIDAYAELNAIVRRHVSVAVRHTALNIDRTAHRVHNAIELG